jgi:hypothetical protein
MTRIQIINSKLLNLFGRGGLVNKTEFSWPTPPRLRESGGFATFFLIAQPPLLC